jgi:hypothetical protein
MPFQFTQGQTTALRTINKAKFGGLAPARQVEAIVKWILANNNNSAMPSWPVTKIDTATYVEAIGEHLGLYTGNPTFQANLNPLKGVGDQFKEVIGSFGRVPAVVVYQICVGYKIQRPVIMRACSHMAAAQGDNGVKTLSGGGGNLAELKLMAMGGERVYATSKTGGTFLFDKIAKHT